MERCDSLVGRAVAVALALAGAAGVAGCGAGVGACVQGSAGCNLGPPTPALALERYRFTAAVGESVSLHAIVTYLSTERLAYSLQWCRRPKDSRDCTPIAGATAERYLVPAVNLSNDGDAYQVALSDGRGSRLEEALLTVSSGPPALHEDGEFVPSDWEATTVLFPEGFNATATTEQVPAGGHPGAYLQLTYRPLGSGGQIEVRSLRWAAVHDPAVQGAIKVVDLEFDCARLTAAWNYMTAQPMIEQSGRYYLPKAFETGIECIGEGWVPVRAYSLAQLDFWQFDGPACSDAARCPDFSTTGAPIRMGWRTTLLVPEGAPSDPVLQGIDNWKATVWHP